MRIRSHTTSLLFSFSHLAAMLLLGAVMMAPVGVQAQIYVDADAMGASDGSSWADAYTDLQNALTAATGNDEIWVAEGVYTPSSAVDSFVVTGAQNGLGIYGGFDGTESSRSGRDPSTHRTVLSGDVDGDDTDGDADGVIENVADINGANANHVLFVDGSAGGDITTATVIDGVTVTAGQTDGSYPGNSGAGLYCEARYGNDCNPTLRQVQFVGNTATYGGAIFNNGVDATSSPIIRGATFNSNAAEYGGAIYNESEAGVSSPTIENTTFTDNTATNDGGALYNNGYDGISNPTLTGVTFDGNSAGGNGGAMYNEGEFGESTPTITTATFTSNTAGGDGGAIYSDAAGYVASPRITNAAFANNSASGAGGALFFFGAGGTIDALVTNSVFANNGPDHVGFNDGAAGEQPRIVGSTFIGATTRVLTVRAFDDGQTPLKIVNSVLWSTGGDIAGGAATSPDAAVDVTYAIVDEASYAEGETNGGTGNRNQDPLFADGTMPAGADGLFGTADDGLRVQAGSPALDGGLNGAVPTDATDLDGDGNTAEELPYDITGSSRLTNNDPDATAATVDLGAYEAPPSTVLPVELAGVEATATDDAVTLTWQTVSETGNAGFRIQRRVKASRRDASTPSLDGEADGWQTVGSVSGAGTTAEAQSYQFADEDLPYEADSLTYRLKQIDTDGTASYSDPITVDRSAVTELELLGTYPNPAQSRAAVRFAVPESAGEQEVQLRLYDVMGRQVRTVQATAKAGRQQMQLRTSDLASGVYFLRLSAGGTAQTRKLTVVQ